MGENNVVDTLEVKVTGSGVEELCKSLNALATAMSKVTGPARRAAKATEEVAEATKKAGKAASTATSGIKKFVASLGKIATVRVLRMIIRELFETISNGMENAYWYSKQSSGAAGEYAQRMDALASAWSKLGNQAGAAFAQLLQTITPALTFIINGLTKIFEVITKIIAYVTGKTGYYKAADVTKSMYEDTKKGAQAAKEWKNQLMGFDEINRLEDTTSSSGSSSSGSSEDYSNLYEWVPFENPLNLNFDWMDTIILKMNNFKDKLNGWIESLKSKLPSLSSIFENIKLGMADLNTALSAPLPTPRTDGLMTAFQNVQTFFNNMLISMSNDGQAISNSINSAFSQLSQGVTSSVQNMKDRIAEKFTEVKEKVSENSGLMARVYTESLKLMKGNTSIMLPAMANIFVNAFKKSNNEIDNHGKKWEGFRSKLSGIIDSILGYIDRLVSKLSSINLADLTGVVGGSGLIGAFSSITFAASGGYINEGQLFVANEAGPELVGTVNGKTAVASNQEITGITTAVYSIGNAIVSAVNGKNTEITLDGKKLAEALYPYSQAASTRHGISMVNA